MAARRKPANEELDLEVLRRAVEYGIDLSLLRERLRLTPTARLERHQAALKFMHEVREAGLAHRRGRSG